MVGSSPNVWPRGTNTILPYLPTFLFGNIAMLFSERNEYEYTTTQLLLFLFLEHEEDLRISYLQKEIISFVSY